MSDWDTTVSGDTAVIRSPERLTMVAAPRLKQLVDATVRDGAPRVVVDLSGTDFIDSSGLGALVGGLKVARQGGGDLRLACAGTQVRTVLGLTNLDRVLRLHDTVDDATHGW